MSSVADAPRVCLFDLEFPVRLGRHLSRPAAQGGVLEILTDTGTSPTATALIKSMLTFNEKLHVFTAPADMLPLDIISPEDMGRLIDMAQANFDFVIIDMPTTVVAWTEAMLTRAHVYFALLELICARPRTCCGSSAR
jgi:pilus assembly protein CpaE